MSQIEVKSEVTLNGFHGKLNNLKRKKRSLSPGEMSPLHPSDTITSSSSGGSGNVKQNGVHESKTNGEHSKKQKHEINHITEKPLSKEEIKLIERAIQDIKDGKLVVVVDHESRENEGDLIMAAEKATTEKIAFMVNETSGVICVACTGERLDQLHLPQMVEVNTENHQTAFTVTVDYKIGTTTGISASDRAITFRAIADSKSKGEDFARPGHVFPLRARPGGVLERPGHTETAVDLCRYAGLYPAGVLSEIVNKDGSMKRLSDLKIFAQENELTLCSVNQLVRYRQLFPFTDTNKNRMKEDSR